MKYKKTNYSCKRILTNRLFSQQAYSRLDCSQYGFWRIPKLDFQVLDNGCPVFHDLFKILLQDWSTCVLNEHSILEHFKMLNFLAILVVSNWNSIIYNNFTSVHICYFIISFLVTLVFISFNIYNAAKLLVYCSVLGRLRCWTGLTSITPLLLNRWLVYFINSVIRMADYILNIYLEYYVISCDELDCAVNMK